MTSQEEEHYMEDSFKNLIDTELGEWLEARQLPEC